MESIGKRILYIRTEVLHINQTNMANLLKTSQAGLSFVEKGERMPSVGMLENLALLSLNNPRIDILWILTGQQNFTGNLSLLVQRFQNLDARGKETVISCLENQEQLCQKL